MAHGSLELCVRPHCIRCVSRSRLGCVVSHDTMEATFDIHLAATTELRMPLRMMSESCMCDPSFVTPVCAYTPLAEYDLYNVLQYYVVLRK